VSKKQRKAPAHHLLQQRLSEQVWILEEQAAAARRGEDGGVHQTRRAARRLRAALATFRPFFDREQTEPIREQLRWLARSLGDARDAEVVLGLLERELAATEPTLVVGPVRQRMRTQLTATPGDVTGILDDPRYTALVADLRALVAEPPFTDRAHEPAQDVLVPRVERERKRLNRIHRDQDDPHATRRAAKRLRYAYEVLEPAWGAEARRPRKAAQRLTSVLGDRQDGVIARDTLLELSRHAGAAGENGFTYGLLYAAQETREAEHLARAERAWARVRKVSW
jgi:CHAD domain-containing protein